MAVVQDVISLTKADCASPVTYYKSLLVTLIGFKLVLLTGIVGAWLAHKFRRRLSRVKAWGVALVAQLTPRSRSRASSARKTSVASGPVRRRRSVVEIVRVRRVCVVRETATKR